VFSIGKADHQPEIWKEDLLEDLDSQGEGGSSESSEVTVTRSKRGCFVDKGDRTWEDNRYIDAKHTSQCAKKPEDVKSRNKRVKSCKQMKTCADCVNQDAGNWKTTACVWSAGPVSNQWENWDAIEGGSKVDAESGVKKVTRKKDGVLGGRCDFGTSAKGKKSWESNRWIDRKHKAMCTKIDAEEFDLASAKDDGLEQTDECAKLNGATYKNGKETCEKCNNLGYCTGLYTWGRFKGYCACTYNQN